MATDRLTGSWTLEAFHTENNTVDHTHKLAVPLQSVMPSRHVQAWDAVSMSGSEFATIQSGESLPERIVVIKYENEFESLLDLLDLCILEKEIYDLRIKDGTDRDDTKIVSPRSEDYGPDMFDKNEFYRTYREINFQMRVRKVNGSLFNIPSLRGPDNAI